MNILHFAHYNRFSREEGTFFGRTRNGLERFLETLITNDTENNHFVLFFNHFDRSITLEEIKPDGSIQFYSHFVDIDFNERSSLKSVFHDILKTIQINVFHFHYLQDFVKKIPSILEELGCSAFITTLHDESFLGSVYGKDNKYSFDAQVNDFFARMKRVIFIHETSLERYLSMYAEVIGTKYKKIPNTISLPHVAQTNTAAHLKILVLGHMNEYKGAHIVAELAKNSKYEIHLLGDSEEVIEGAEQHGAYNSNELACRVKEIAPDVVLIPSIVEEVFPYTALESTSLGYPVVVFPVGSLKNIENEHRGFVAKEKTLESMEEQLLRISELKQNKQEWEEIFRNIQNIKFPTPKELVDQYNIEYRDIAETVGESNPQNAILQLQKAAISKENYFYEISKEVERLQDDISKEIRKRKQLDKKLKSAAKSKDVHIKSLEHQIHLQNVAFAEKQRRFKMLRRLKHSVQKRGGLKTTTINMKKAFVRDGVKGTYYRFKDQSRYDSFLYEKWLERNEKNYTPSQVETMLAAMKIKPKFSFLIPVYNVGEEYLRVCLDSILEQQYTNWELCLADDASTDPHVRPILEEYANKDSRIKVVFREKNGHISAATNSALEIATGDFIALVDNDDFIRPNALLEIAKLINEHPDAEMIYTDEDKTDAAGKVRLSPYFKPDWSPDAFWGHMYLCHLGVYKAEIARKIGGFRIGYEGAQDYDFALRFSEQTKHIYHVPQILYHWRMIPTSTAASGDNKSYAYDASIRAKESAIERRGYNGIVEVEARQLSTNVYFKPEETDFISIIIPTKNHGKDVERLLHSIYQYSTWENFEIILINNNSDEEESLQIFKNLQAEYASLKVVDMPIPFNYSQLNNEATKYAKGNLFLFLNNDMEIMTPDWLERLAGQAKLPYAGAVGAKLYYPNNQIQHAGVLGFNGSPVHAFHNFFRGELGYFGRLSLTYNYLAVTGACLMVERHKFEEVGGFDAENLPVSYQDVDFCLKLYDKGYFNSVRADAELYHYESQTRGYDDTEEKRARMENEKAVLNQRWSRYLTNDPFYNENLTQKKVDFTINYDKK